MANCDFGIHTGMSSTTTGSRPFPASPLHPPMRVSAQHPLLSPARATTTTRPTSSTGTPTVLGGYIDQFHLFHTNADQTEEFYPRLRQRPLRLHQLGHAFWGPPAPVAVFGGGQRPPTRSGSCISTTLPTRAASKGRGLSLRFARWEASGVLRQQGGHRFFTGHNHWYERTHPIPQHRRQPDPHRDDYVNPDRPTTSGRSTS